MTKVTRESFLENVKEHELTIVSDIGNVRHLTMKKPNDLTYHYHITTWEDHLCISGDMGCYVFSRTEDMFRFFRTGSEELNINEYYWHEKLVSESLYVPSKKFSPEKFNEYLEDSLNTYCEYNEMSDDWKEKVLNQMKGDLFFPESEYEGRESINNQSWHDFSCESLEEFADYLENDSIEEDFQILSDHFIWCLYAIVYAIKKYDNLIKGE
jgi:hypothetical protein